MNLKQQFESTIDHACTELQLNREKVFDLFLDNAEQYLNLWIGDLPQETRDVFLNEPSMGFWAWFKQVWINTDKQMFAEMDRFDLWANTIKQDTHYIYRVWHNPKRIKIRPDSTIYENVNRRLRSIEFLTNQNQ